MGAGSYLTSYEDVRQVATYFGNNLLVGNIVFYPLARDLLNCRLQPLIALSLMDGLGLPLRSVLFSIFGTCEYSSGDIYLQVSLSFFFSCI